MNYMYILFILNIPLKVIANDVIGCGGFIKSHVPIDFSKVEVKLYTKQGILKDTTNCAPNNGYYFIPVYDKGEYILEIEPPPGWSFNPRKVHITVDGTSDLCSQGKDINYVFKGFGITGKVQSYNGDGRGPSGVEVKLQSNLGTRTTISGVDGSFFFTPVYPGNYTVSFSHAKWKLHKSSINVQVTEGNTELPEYSLVVSGYDVSSIVKSDSEPIKGAYLILFRDDSHKGPIQIDGCDTSPISDFKSNMQPLCHVVSTEMGTFTFPTISPGKYFVMPFYKGQNIHFMPPSVHFTVTHDSLMLPRPFEVIGFSLTGTVLNSENGKPLEGAKIFLNGQEVYVTKANGIYTLQQLKSGTYKIQVKANNLKFAEKIHKINPSSLKIPDFFPSEYEVCGTVLSEKQHTVSVARLGSNFSTTTLSEQSKGLFCLFLAPGKYQFEVVVSNEEKNQGVQFFPVSHTVEVPSSRVVDISFSQLKAVVSGKVQCLRQKDCESLKLILRPYINGVTDEGSETFANLIDYTFTFDEVRPGNYEVLLIPNKYCWQQNKYIIIVNAVSITVPTFVQSGYSVEFVSSHDTKALYKVPNNESKVHINIVKGRSSYCVEKPGSYEFVLESCHTYENNRLSFNTDLENREIFLSAQKHSVTLTIGATENIDDVFVTVNIGGLKNQQGPLPYNNNQYTVELFLSPSESAILVPQSNILYFDPPILSIGGSSDCIDVGVKFVAVRGKVFKGKVIPPLSGVVVSVETENSESLMDETDAEGNYKFPPLNYSKLYKLSAKKDSYVLVGPNEEGNFLAHKLAEVIVEVFDEVDNQPLQGALLSLSGSESYRSNLQTNENGKIIFRSLSPSEYFLKPMMKEYSFSPSSRMIRVEEGATVTVQLNGKRVAYSAFGHITSLNGEPEEGMIVTAAGTGNCSHFSEEATSESSGRFRIRGLHPYCAYEIKVKGSLDEKYPIERAAPSSINFLAVNGDISDIKIVVFRPNQNTDVLVRVHASNPEHYKSLRIKLLRESSPSALIHTTKVDTTSLKLTKDYNPGVLIQVPSVPLDDKVYYVQLESTLSSQSTKNKAHVYYFAANTSFKYVDLTFLMKSNSTEQHIKQTSAWTLVFIFGSIFAVYNIEYLAEVFKQQLSKLNIGHIIPNLKYKPTVADYSVDNNEIDQLVQSINAPKRKVKPRKV